MLAVRTIAEKDGQTYQVPPVSSITAEALEAPRIPWRPEAHAQQAAPEEKTERAAPSHSVVGSGEPSCACPICGTPLKGRQTSACSDRCRAALSRRRRTEGQAEKERRVRELLEAAVRVLGGSTKR